MTLADRNLPIEFRGMDSIPERIHCDKNDRELLRPPRIVLNVMNFGVIFERFQNGLAHRAQPSPW